MRRSVAFVGALLVSVAGLALAGPGVGAQPAVTVTPSTGVIDGQTVTVEGTGFEPGLTAGTTLCSVTVVQSEDLADCDSSEFGLGGVAGDGTVTFELKAQRWLRVGQEVIDCSQPGLCVAVIGSATAGVSFVDGAAAAIQFDETIANDPPLLVESEIIAWTPHSATVAVTCSRSDHVTITVHLSQAVPDVHEDFWPIRTGSEIFECDGDHQLQLPLQPRQRYGYRDVVYPYRRLRPGSAMLDLLTESRTEDRWQVDREVSQTVQLLDPTLQERLTFDAGSASVRALGVRTSRRGEATAKVQLTCTTDQIVQYVQVEALAPAPGAAYRQALGGERDLPCGPTPTTALVPLTELSRRSREDIVPAGPVELYTSVADERFDRSYDLRPVTTRRDMVPGSVRVAFDPASRLRIGPVTTEGVRVSFRCKRTARFTVFATIGQPVGQVVFQEDDRIVIICAAGRTVVFDVPWRGDDSAVRRNWTTAVTVRAINGKHTHWNGPWQQEQGGWRTSR